VNYFTLPFVHLFFSISDGVGSVGQGLCKYSTKYSEFSAKRMDILRYIYGMEKYFKVVLTNT